MPLDKVTWWVWALRSDKRYARFEVARRSGAPPRVIHAPIKPIKDLQRQLATILLRAYEPRVHVHGFVNGRSPLTNAQQHEHQRWLLKLDLEDFFPTINFGRVRGVFMSHPFDYPADVATLLAQICCHRNELPQGAPTSPILSNFVCRGLDGDLGRLARAHRCRFTRYADDLCFSSNVTAFPSALATLGGGEVRLSEQLTLIIRRHGFAINPDKTRLVRRSRRQRVTGLVVNRKANVPSDYVRSLRNLLFILRVHGELAAKEALARVEDPRARPAAMGEVSFKALVRGRVQYVGSVKGWSNPTYRRLAKTLASLDPDFHPRTLYELHGPQRVRIFTEGPTDLVHLSVALNDFHRRGEFENLRFEVVESASAGGASKLMLKSEELAAEDQNVPCVCLFDRDDEDIIRQIGTTGFRQRGHNVTAVLMSPPEWRDQRICIEMLYPDGDLVSGEADGRRFYLTEEFDPWTGQHLSEDGVYIPHPDKRPTRKLVPELVFRMGSSNNIQLAKTGFASAVANGEGPFANFSFEGFRRTLEVIEEAVVRISQ